MQKCIIGKKVGMTQIFDEKGNVIPVTVVEAGPCVVVTKKTAENAGYEAMVYTNWNQAFYDLYLEELAEYDLWLAMYEADMEFPYKIDMWQYSCTGSVPGVEGPVDLNIYFKYE